MNAIRSYIENVFASLPKTHVVLKVKADMLANMEEKYQELKDRGRSENEAVGQVISEFGNIDELLAELQIKHVSEVSKSKEIHQVSQQESEDWINAKKRSGLLTAIGVFLILFGVAALIYFSASFTHLEWLPVSFKGDVNPAFGITFMLLMIAAAVGLFIYSGVRLEKFTFYKKDFELKGNLEHRIQDMKDEFMSSYTISLVIGVIMCILAPLVIILPVVLFEVGDLVVLFVVFMLLLIAVAVFLFTYFGGIKEAYDRLLKTGDYCEEPENKIIQAISSAIWPLAVLIFLLMGFLGGLWHIAWIVFPVTALLSASFLTIYKAVNKK
jgi:hypothetical protein